MDNVEPVLGDIDAEWHRVAPALEKLACTSPAFELLPDEVRTECQTEQAELWVVPEAFLVTRFIIDASTKTRTLFIWVAATFEGNTLAVGKYLPFFDEVAKHTGCKYIECWSSRLGMERYLAKQGFDLFYRSFRKTV